MSALIGGEQDCWSFDDGSGNSAANRIRGRQPLGIRSGSAVWTATSAPLLTPNPYAIQTSGAEWATASAIATIGSFSVSVWLYQITHNPFPGEWIAQQRDFETQPFWQIRRTGSPGSPTGFTLRTSAGISYDLDIQADGLTLLQWHHIVAVVNDNSKIITIYLNGSQVASASYSGSVNISSRLAIGFRGWSGTSTPFDGIIDDLRIFNKALNTAEITILSVGGPLTDSSNRGFPLSRLVN